MSKNGKRFYLFVARLLFIIFKLFVFKLLQHYTINIVIVIASQHILFFETAKGIGMEGIKANARVATTPTSYHCACSDDALVVAHRVVQPPQRQRRRMHDMVPIY